MKRIIALLLALIMLFSLAACTGKNKNTEAPSISPDTTSPTETATPVPTPEPTEAPVYSDADLAFMDFDKELFISIVTSDGLSFHQYVKDPASFGIDEADVERGWGDFSYDSYLEGMNGDLELKAELEAIEYDQLSEYNKLAYDNIMLLINKSIDEGDTFYFSEPLTPLNGDHSMLPLMLTLYEINDREDIENYLTLLEDSGRYLGQIAQFETEKAEKGMFMTENALDQVIESCNKFVKAGKKFFLIGFFKDLMDENDFGLTEEERQAYINRNDDYILNELLPAYSNLVSTLESLRPKCSAFVGIKDRGEDALNWYINSIQSSGACYYDVSDIEERLGELCISTLYEMAYTLQTDNEIIRHYFDDVTSGSPEEDVDYLKSLIESTYPYLADQDISYVTVPDAIADEFSPAAYLVSAYDDPTRNIVMFNPSSDTDNLLFTLAHECYPGHLYQTQYFRGLPELSLSQQLLAPTGYTEGWAVMSEMFIADYTDEYYAPACKVVQLESTLINILLPAYCGLKINMDGWTKEQAMDYLSGFGLDQDDYYEVINEYAINMPTYFFNYAIGYMCTKLIYDRANCNSDAENKEFFTEYLNYGPCVFNILFEKFSVRF